MSAGTNAAPPAPRALVAREEGGVAVVTINRPEARNALDAETLDAVGAAFAEVERDPQVRCVILVGAGERAFAAGADIKAMADADPSSADVLVGHAQRLARPPGGFAPAGHRGRARVRAGRRAASWRWPATSSSPRAPPRWASPRWAWA